MTNDDIRREAPDEPLDQPLDEEGEPLFPVRIMFGDRVVDTFVRAGSLKAGRKGEATAPPDPEDGSAP